MNAISAALSGWAAYACHRRTFVSASSVLTAHASLAATVPGSFALAGRVCKQILVPSFFATIFQGVAIAQIGQLAEKIFSSQAPSLEDLQIRVISTQCPTKQSTSELAGQIYKKLKEERSTPWQSEETIATLNELRQRVDEWIEILATPNNPNPDVIEHRAFMVLASNGLRNEHFHNLASHLSLREEDAPFISLYLASQNVYTQEDLRDTGICPGNTSVEEMVSAFKQFSSPFSRLLPACRLLSKATIVLGKILAVAFQAIGLYVACMTYSSATVAPGISFALAYYLFPMHQFSFIEANWFGKVFWIYRNSNPFCPLGAAIGRGLRSFSVQAAVNTYFS